MCTVAETSVTSARVAINDCDDFGTDPVYEKFLNHVRIDGHSYVFEMGDEDNSSSAVKLIYEEETELPAMAEPESKDISGNVSGKSDCANKRNFGNRRPIIAPFRTVPMTSESTGFPSEDASYLKFLSCVTLQEGNIVFEWQSDVGVIYEEGAGLPSTTNEFPTENALCSDRQELVPYINNDQQFDSQLKSPFDRFDEPFEFKEKLEELLSKPYDHNEYEELLKEATRRKPLNKQKHLRKMSISYATAEDGMSYLDHHPELAIQIADADCQRGLLLLRGFFFWLKNLCHEGAFMPWISESFVPIPLLTSGCGLVLPLDATVVEI